MNTYSRGAYGEPCVFSSTELSKGIRQLLRLIDKIRQRHNYHRFEKSPGAMSLYARKKQGEELNGEFMRRAAAGDGEPVITDLGIT